MVIFSSSLNIVIPSKKMVSSMMEEEEESQRSPVVQSSSVSQEEESEARVPAAAERDDGVESSSQPAADTILTDRVNSSISGGPPSHLKGGIGDIDPPAIKQIPIGDHRLRSKLRFEVVTARVVETSGKKHVVYSVMMKRHALGLNAGSGGGSLGGADSRPAVIDRRYNDFCYVYECILRSFHPSILGDFAFPKKVLIGNFKAEVITERTDAFHKFLNLIANCENLLYSEYFYAFLSSEEHNEAVSFIKLGRFNEAIPLLENIFHVREKLLTISSIHVLAVLCELVACQEAVGKYEDGYAYALVTMRAFELQHKTTVSNGNGAAAPTGSNQQQHPEVEAMKVPFLLSASNLATKLGHNKKAFDKQLSELRYKGVKISGVKSLLEVIKEKYIHRASHTAKLA